MANLLIQPIQRIPRYNLLLRDLLEKTDATHPDYNHLKVALATLEGVMEYLDKNITEIENIEKMLKFSSVKGADVSLFKENLFHKRYMLIILIFLGFSTTKS